MSLNYVARCKCRSVVFAIADEPGMREDLAKELPRLILDGYSIEKMTDQQVRDNFDNCKCEGKQQNIDKPESVRTQTVKSPCLKECLKVNDHDHCHAKNKNGYICSRKLFHQGKHVACANVCAVKVW